MTTAEAVMEGLRYPIGRYERPVVVTADERMEAVERLAEMPNALREVVRGMDSAQLGTPYREGGWTVRQLVHHVADSHMNAVLRVKLALTEEWPTIVAYDEKAWAQLQDGAGAPVDWSMELIESLHARWVLLLQGLRGTEWERGFVHPENGRVTVERATLLYAWHGRHHVAQVQRLRERKEW